MKPTQAQLRQLDTGLNPAAIDQHLERLDEEYFNRFDADQVARHIAAIGKLTGERPVRVVVDRDGPDVSVTVIASDYPGVFALIAGLLAANGLVVRSGEVFTYRTTATRPQAGPTDAKRFRRLVRKHRHGRDSPDVAARRRRIIDHFVGALPEGLSVERFAEQLDESLTEVIRLLERRDEASARAARHRVNEMVTQRLGALRLGDEPVLYPVQIDPVEGDAERTWLKVTAQDTPAFLYALSTALSLQGVSIERLRINTTDEAVEDVLGFVDAAGKPITDAEALNRIKLTALLAKQFTYFLDKAPDPYTALSRFEQMVEDLIRRPESGEWVAMLKNPRSMKHLARLLGASDYLWEEFIRLQYEALMPIFADQIGDAPLYADSPGVAQRLAGALAEAKTHGEKRKTLNKFKNREVFRIDLDQVLRDTDFRTFAGRLTALAEAVVGAAFDMAYEAMRTKHGQPRDAERRVIGWAVFGLGKLGGEALGYASDIELMFVYDGVGQTDGAEPIHAGEFFNTLVREAANLIEAKQEGIFRVDFRLRPYGKNAPLAAHREVFERYYAPGGDAQAFERQALVRLRAIGGDGALGEKVCALRDKLVYESGPIDLEQLWEMRAMQHRQKAGGLRFNAKYSLGALVDVEYAVQTLQVRHGGAHPGVRTPRVHEAIGALRDAGVLGADDADRLRAGYDFYRRLINGLRMLRGNATDLVVPKAGTADLTYLARRLGYADRADLPAAAQLEADLHQHADAVQGFVRRTFGDRALPAGHRPA